MIEFPCSRCLEPMSAPDSLIGQYEACPSCGAETQVPPRNTPTQQSGETVPVPMSHPLRWIISSKWSLFVGAGVVGLVLVGILVSSFADRKPKERATYPGSGIVSFTFEKGLTPTTAQASMIYDAETHEPIKATVYRKDAEWLPERTLFGFSGPVRWNGTAHGKWELSFVDKGDFYTSRVWFFFGEAVSEEQYLIRCHQAGLDP